MYSYVLFTGNIELYVHFQMGGCKGSTMGEGCYWWVWTLPPQLRQQISSSVTMEVSVVYKVYIKTVCGPMHLRMPCYRYPLVDYV